MITLTISEYKMPSAANRQWRQKTHRKTLESMGGRSTVNACWKKMF